MSAVYFRWRAFGKGITIEELEDIRDANRMIRDDHQAVAPPPSSPVGNPTSTTVKL
jgi:hypothetical protein